jgi:hypothetical protein
MRLDSLTFPALATAAVALLAAPTLKFAPADATTLKKTITSESKVKGTSVELIVDGEVQDAPEGGPEFSYEASDKFVIVDEYVKSKEGRPTELKRTFEELESGSVQSISVEGESEETKRAKESELTSKTVLFKWDDKKDEYAISFAEGEGDDELLKELDADLDFLAFLPEKEVKEGDEWDVDGAKARVLMFPGGDLKLVSTEDPENDDPAMDRALRENVAGKLTLAHKGIKEEDDAKYVLIEFKGDLKTNGTSETEARGNVTLEVTLSVTGEILWDTKNNHVHSVTMEGQDKTTYATVAELEFAGESHKFEQKITFEGTAKLSMKLSK